MTDPIKVMQNEMACVNRQITGCDRDCQKCDLVLDDSEILAAYEAAIAALEKQIPQETNRMEYDSTPNYVYCSCPICNTVVSRFKKDEYGEIWLKHKPYYCDYCGQALDWSEMEE